MHIFATFEHSLFLELAITELEKKGLPSEDIFAISLNRRKTERNIIDNIHYSDGISIFDGAIVLGSFLMVLGSIYGFILEWGPIIWGLIGLFIGGLVGGTVDYIVRQSKRKTKGKNPKLKKSGEVIVIVKCLKEQVDWVEQVLLDHFALGLGKYDRR